MLKNKKNSRGQIGETMTWVVATLVIIVVLVISGAIVKFSFNSKQLIKYLSDDVLVTKSAVAFFNEDKNFENLEKAIEEEDYTLVKPKIERLLKEISLSNEQDFRVLIDGELQDSSVIKNYAHGLVSNERSFFKFSLNDKIIILRFYGGIE